MPVHSNIFQNIPFIRISCLFLGGILLSHYFPSDVRISAIICSALIVFLILLWWNNSFVLLKYQNFSVAAGLFMIGYFYPAKSFERPLPPFDRKDYYMAEVCQKPAEKAKSFQTVLVLKSAQLSRSEKVIAYFSKEQFDQTITTGDQLIVLAKPQLIKNMGNPFEFDYQSMMKAKNIWFSVYLSNGNYLKTGVSVNRPVYWAEKFRDKLLNHLNRHITHREERSVISALTLGYRAEIDKETVDYFASTGAMHVLSVSGLHVGLIYFILAFFLKHIKRGRAGRISFVFIMLFFLWAYAFISGFSPSVQRATVMFSFVILGESIRRPANIFNSITASALFLVLLNPEVIFDIGFQLSYLAVLGIVLMQPAFFELITIKNRLLRWFWSLTTVSIAAQLTTFPLGLFYFNQFPNFFWLSNFIVIPATTLIIWLTLAFFILTPLTGLVSILGFVIEKLTFAMLWTLKLLDSLPYAVSEGIALEPIQVAWAFAGLMAIIVFFATKKKIWLVNFLVSILLFQISGLAAKSQLFDQKKIIVYNSKNLMIHLIDGRKNYLITKDFKSLAESEKQIYEKSATHLRLNLTEIISLNDSAATDRSDLKISSNIILFQNTLLRLETFKEFSNSGEVIYLAISDSIQSGKIIKSQILATTSIPQGRSDLNYFRIKTEGAFYANLNGND